MTRGEFIDWYRRRNHIPEAWWTPDGYTPDYAHAAARIAVPCDCGEEGCMGWGMDMVDPFADEM